MDSRGWRVLTAKLILLVSYIYQGQCLECPKCTNVEVLDGSSALRSRVQGKSNPSCGDTLDRSTVLHVACPSDGYLYQCGYVDGTITASTLLFGRFTLKVYSRDCIRTVTSSSGCLDKDEAKSALMAQMSALQELSDIQVDADVCYCNQDDCDAGTCSSGLKIGGNCMVWYMWLGPLAAIVVFFILVCYCCCRRKSSSSHMTSTAGPVPQAPLPQAGTAGQYPAPRQTQYNAGYDQPSDVI